MSFTLYTSNDDITIWNKCQFWLDDTTFWKKYQFLVENVSSFRKKLIGKIESFLNANFDLNEG